MPPVAHRSEYWRSLEDLADTPEFRSYVESEFPTRAQELVDPLSRRRFLQVMGASLALAGATGCDFMRWPQEELLPFASRPQHRHPGVTVKYATSWDFLGVGAGLLVTSYDGRPIKVDGNAACPTSRGASDAFMQASLLDLYDPDRSQAVRKLAPAADEAAPTWETFEAALAGPLATVSGAQGAGLAIVTRATSSPSWQRLAQKLREKLPKALLASWEPIECDALVEGASLAYGRWLRPQLDLAAADIVVSLDADLFSPGFPAALKLARDFSSRRRPAGDMHGNVMDQRPGKKLNRLYVAEGTFSVTGGMADHRLAVRTSQVPALARKLVAALVDAGLDRPQGVDEAWLTTNRATAEDAAAPYVRRLAKDLLAARGASVIVAGPRQPAHVHALAYLLNDVLGNVGKTITFTEDPEAVRQGDAVVRPTRAAGLRQVADALEAGQVSLAVVIGANPVHDAPADLGFAEAYRKQGVFSVHVGHQCDETGLASTWHVPLAHPLESWGDARGWDGTVTAMQPLIAPLFAGRTGCEVLALLLGESKLRRKGYEITRATFKARTNLADQPLERAWRRFLHDGALEGSAAPAVTGLRARGADVMQAVANATDLPAPAVGEVEVTFTQDEHVWDGRWANNAWLQELPGPMTKLTWDNALMVSPVTANELGVKADDVVRLTLKGTSPTTIEVPVYVLPGMPRKGAALSLGYGRGAAAGVVGGGTGLPAPFGNAYPLRRQSGLDVAVCKVDDANKAYYLATTQDHHAIRTPIGDTETQDRVFGRERLEFEDGPQGKQVVAAVEPTKYPNPLFREATVEEHAQNPRFAKIIVGPDPLKTQMWDPPIRYGEGYQWGMTIDLSVCNGCSACVMACVAENNIPVVGKSEVARGREMHWLRIDRYFKGDPLEGEGATATEGEEAWTPRPLQVAHQPIPCMQCENAPCEAVCPVAATTHSEEGLNDMAYNRCVGTRYCANNCSYKVRRFNYFWNHHGPFHPRSNPISDDQGQPYRKLPKPAIAIPEVHALERMAYNPDVTVRSRGVMEKCTYCVQRIQKVTIKARNEQRAVRDGEITTACQDSCPTRAITFGNLNDPEAAVSKLLRDDRTYALLGELNTRPRTQFLAKLRNPGVESES